MKLVYDYLQSLPGEEINEADREKFLAVLKKLTGLKALRVELKVRKSAIWPDVPVRVLVYPNKDQLVLRDAHLFVTVVKPRFGRDKIKGAFVVDLERPVSWNI